MAFTKYDPALTASFLFNTWYMGEIVTALPADLKPLTLKDGYDAQDQLFLKTEEVRTGWKLGVGCPAAMHFGKLSRPLIGQLSKSRCHKSPANLKMSSLYTITVECEIAFILDRDIAPVMGRKVQVEDIRHICVSFEIVRSRFRDRRNVGWPSFVADNVGFEALVVSEPISSGFDLDLIRAIQESVVVYLDNEPKAWALSGDKATDPLVALQYLYDHAVDRGVILRKGNIVSTGAMCEPFDIKSMEHTISAKFLDREIQFSIY